MNAISIFTGKQPIQQVKRDYHREKRRVNIGQANIINQYNMSMGGVDCMDQNISAYMINLCKKKWRWQHFWFVVDVAVNNAYQINRQSHLNPREYRLDVLCFHRAIVDAFYRLYRKSLSLQRYSQVLAAYITLQTICSLMVSITRLPRAHSDCVSYQDVKKTRYIIAKNAMSVFMLNILNYITGTRAACKVFLKWKKESYTQKSDFPFSFLSPIHNSSNSKQNFKSSNKNISHKIIGRWIIKLFSSLRNICLGKVEEKSFCTSMYKFSRSNTRTLLILE